MKLSFHGADRSVTGSCHLVECAGKRILIDCGLYQGSRELDEENAAPFGFDAAAMDYVLLTHAHLDHCGRLPLLAKRGFRGEVIMTSASRELARLVMLDAAHLQEEDARYHPRQVRHDGASQDNNKPLYSTLDALNCLDYFGRTAIYDQVLEVGHWGTCYLHRRWPHSGLGQHLSRAQGTGPFDQRAVFGGPGQRRSSAAAQPFEATTRRKRRDGNHIRRPLAQAIGPID